MRWRDTLPWAACLVVLVLAAARAWTCDDAYISFRYADNLVRGMGLVFNQGERVEGFTNLAWTLYSAMGHGIGVAPETWAHAGSLLAFLGVLVLLARTPADEPRLVLRGVVIPVAVLLAATCVHLLDFATGGLETSLFALLALASYRALSPGSGEGPSTLRSVLGGLLLAACALTRPDGVIFAAVLVPALLLRRRVRSAATVVAMFSLLWIPATLWRVSYFGDFFPNTYYAKSADVAWWTQGAFYVGVFALRYWPLFLSIPLCVWCWLRRADRRLERAGPTLVELALVVAYTVYVARVGGDFMFGRLLVPIVPFLLLLLDRGIRQLALPAPVGGAVVGAAMLAMLVSPTILGRGITDERAYYEAADWWQAMDEEGKGLRKFFDGLDVRMCFFGSEARLVYYSRVRIAIDCEAGLTDRHIARQRLVTRARVGHEKAPTAAYALGERGVRFLFRLAWGASQLGLDRYIPDVPIHFGRVRGRVLTWDAPLMAALAARGAKFPDVPAEVDRFTARAASLPPEAARRAAEGLRRLYFHHTPDAARAMALDAALSRVRDHGVP